MNENQEVTVGQINSRLKQMFGRMQIEGINYSSFQNAINRNPINDAFLSNPYIQNKRIKNSNEKAVGKTKQELQKALQSPDDNEQVFRQASLSLYYQNYVYANLIKLNRDIPQFFNYIIPQGVEKADLKKADFIKEKKFVQQFIDKFDIPITYKDVSLQVAQEGKCSYIFRSSQDLKKDIVDFALLQKLPPEYIKYTGYGSDSPLICSFNFLMFLNPIYNIKQWPSWMEDIWVQLKENGVIGEISTQNGSINLTFDPSKRLSPNHIIEGINGSYAYWVELPQDLVYTFGVDFSTPLAMPEYVGLFSDLSELESYKWLQSQTMLTNITNVLTAEVPVDKEATGGSDAAILSPEVILGLEGDCSSSLNSNILPFFAPLQNFKMHSVEHVPNAQDISLGALRNVINSAGASGLISTTDKPSISMIKATQQLYESRSDYLTLQYQKFINLIINKYLGLKYKFKCIIWGGVYNWRDEVKTLKELIQNGHRGLMPKLLSAYRITIDDYKTLYDYVDNMEIFAEEEKISSSPTSTSTTKKVGRPNLEDGDIENDNTSNSKEQGGNVSDVKE